MYIILLLLSINPTPQPIKDHVDRVEVNHFYTPECSYVFTQVIFWNWNLDKDRYEVVDWIMDKPGEKIYTPEEYKIANEKWIKSQEDFIIEDAIKRHIRIYELRNIKYTLNKEKFKQNYLTKNKIKTTPLSNHYWIGSSISIPVDNKLIFEDPKNHHMREITFGIIEYTTTQYDPELKNRDILPQDKRIGFSKPSPKNK